MKNKVQDFTKLYIYVVGFGIIINFLIFQLGLIENSYFICVEIIKNKFEVFNSSIALNYPQSCDQGNYYEGFFSFNEIINKNHPYQTRPIYIFAVYVVYKTLSLFSTENILLMHLAVFLIHCFILSISIKLFTLIKKIKPQDLLLVIPIAIMNPIFKWGLFTPSNQTLTFLEIIYCLYLIKHVDSINFKKQSLILGILILAHRPFALCYFLMIFWHNVVINKFKNISIIDEIKNALIFISPWIVFRGYIYINGYIPYDDLARTWGQFKWIFDYIRGLISYESEWHCVTMPENFICYFSDSLDTFLYLSIPLIGALIYFVQNKKNFLDYKSELLIIFLMFYSFYSLIGWYPPLRFNLYSISNTLCLFLIISIVSSNRVLSKNIYILGNIIYLFGLNHWNAPEVLIPNLYIILGSIFITLSLIYPERLIKKLIPNSVK